MEMDDPEIQKNTVLLWGKIIFPEILSIEVST